MSATLDPLSGEGRTPASEAIAAAGDEAWDWPLEGPSGAPTLPAALADQVHPDDLPGLHEALRQHRAEPAQRCVAEFRRRAAGGGWCWWQGRGRIVEGPPPRLLGVLTDVDAQRDRLLALQLSRDQFQAVYEASPDAMGITRMADGRYIDVNPGFERITGYRRDEVVGRTSVEVGIWASDAERQRMLEAYRRDGFVDALEMTARTRSGHVIYGEMSVRVVRIDGNDCFVFSYRDISAQKRMQAERAAAEAASRAKTEFLSRISHELRTPLNAVLGFAQVLGNDRRHPLDDEQSARVMAIQHAGWHLLALINDVLDVSRIESGRLHVAREPVVLQALYDEVRAITAAQAFERGVTLHAAIDPQLRVLGDAVRLRQVLLNVMGNAIKYNRPGGHVHVAASCTDERAELSVADTGHGMSPQQLQHLFEPFNRLGREASGIEGTGIGMALVQQLVELMGGHVAVRSRAGEGTVVQLSLPLAGPGPAGVPVPDPAPPLPLPPPPGPCTVLYIEDNTVNQLVVQQMLARWPTVRLLLAETGAQGLALARAEHPHLVLLDMHLPDTTGLALLDTLRADDALRRLPVVALSASAMPEDQALARSHGADDYWTKPVEMLRFLNDIARKLPMA